MDWNLVEHQATASWADTTAVVDTLDLRAGLSIRSGFWQGSVIGSLPAIRPANSPASVETYVRGTDLVTTHPAAADRPIRVQLYWRRWHDLPSGIDAALELIASVQTHLLDSNPALVIESRFLRAGDASRSEGKIELNCGENTVLILAHPDEDSETEQFREQESMVGCAVRHTLFRQRLEKGVILRGRILFCWSNQVVGTETAESIQKRFLSAEPMLTA